MRGTFGHLLQSFTRLAKGQNTQLRHISATWCRNSVLEEVVQPVASTSGRSDRTAEDYRALEAQIFGNRLGNGQRSGAKVLRKKLLGDKVASYYPEPISKHDPMFVSLRAERQKAKLEKLKRRGKGPPPKGQGKRSSGGKRK